ncbi:MAG: DUF5685 family protein [Lachnospiraceae bacterium]|nr:DUF5685 family protein [Lachnospiraceae bacterium]
MFGYVIADRQQMSDEEKEEYKSYYCGLCKEMQKIAGFKGSVVLSYDVAFLYILLSGLYEPSGIVSLEKCSVHPFRKYKVVTNPIADYAASMNILLGYYNLMDDYEDERDHKKKMLADYLKKYLDQIEGKYPRQFNAVAHNIECITKAEQSHEENIDIPAGKTGQMLAEIFAMKEDEWQDDLRNMGYYIGKFVYVLDAYLDIDRDRKTGSYNPFIAKQNSDPKGFEDYIEMTLTSMMSETARSFEVLPIVQDVSILRNVLYSGVWSAFKAHQYKMQKKQGQEAEEEDSIGSIQSARRTV